MAMKKLIDEIAVIPGVTGSCVFDKIEGPLCVDSDAGIATDVLKKVGSYLIRMMKMGGMNGLDITTSHFRLDSCSVVGMPLDSGSVLLTVCDTNANCSLIATTAEMLAADMREELDKEVNDERNAGGEGILEALEAIDNNMIDIDVQVHLNEMEEALADVIGPVAGIVIKNYIDKWQEEGPAVASRLRELAEMLATEISDASLVRQFRARVQEMF